MSYENGNIGFQDVSAQANYSTLKLQSYGVTKPPQLWSQQGVEKCIATSGKCIAVPYCFIVASTINHRFIGKGLLGSPG